jgi:hypothetical protein
MQAYKGYTQIELTVLAGTGFWIVTDQGRPINIKSINHGIAVSNLPKYLKNGWPTPKPAENLAAKLNRYFKTDRFEPTKLL